MGTRFLTPGDVARSMGSELPRNAALVLDPAVGDGALLAGASSAVDNAKFIGVDIDGGVRAALWDRLEGCGIGDSFRFIRSDFIRLSNRALRGGWAQVDAIIMNPPFLARRRQYVKTAEVDYFACGGSSSVPIEVLFLIRAIAMLRDRGTLVALLPGSIVAGEKATSVRKWVARQGTIQKIHELPDGVFRGVESKFFVVVFRKGVCGGAAELCNHEIPGIPLGKISHDKLLGGVRWDYSWFVGVRAIWNAYTKADLGWIAISTVATVTRGRITSQVEKAHSLHTCDYNNAAWHVKDEHTRIEDAPCGAARQGDFALARVARNCIDTFGFVLADGAIPVSDCVFVIRPKGPVEVRVYEMLFAVRCWLKCEAARLYLVRGTACRFLSRRDIADLKVPLALASQIPHAFQEYRQAVDHRDNERRAEIEADVAAYIGRVCGRG